MDDLALCLDWFDSPYQSGADGAIRRFKDRRHRLLLVDSDNAENGFAAKGYMVRIGSCFICAIRLYLGLEQVCQSY